MQVGSFDTVFTVHSCHKYDEVVVEYEAHMEQERKQRLDEQARGALERQKERSERPTLPAPGEKGPKRSVYLQLINAELPTAIPPSLLRLFPRAQLHSQPLPDGIRSDLNLGSGGERANGAKAKVSGVSSERNARGEKERIRSEEQRRPAEASPESVASAGRESLLESPSTSLGVDSGSGSGSGSGSPRSLQAADIFVRGGGGSRGGSAGRASSTPEGPEVALEDISAAGLAPWLDPELEEQARRQRLAVIAAFRSQILVGLEQDITGPALLQVRFLSSAV